ncbi:MAG: hypothetical protein EG826_04375 [Deltaproteobacteria bacterium]|nr:hypothetical protein [Deltaproteobacteria bacterium]
MKQIILSALIWAAVISFVLFVFLWSLIPPSIKADADAQKWTNDPALRAADSTWRDEQTRLHQKHGLHRVIIYSPQGAYYFNERGQKCPFM